MLKTIKRYRKYWPLFVAFIIALAAGLYFIIRTSLNTRETDNSKIAPPIIQQSTTFESFPKLDYREFYQYIKVKDNRPFIDDEMIARIINYVVVKMQFSGGELKWKYKFLDDARQSLALTFEIVFPESSPGERKYKEYIVTISEKDVL